MPTELDESLTGNGTEIIFPDEATGRQYRLQERQVYEAEEVRDDLDDSEVPKFGSWLPVTLSDRDGEEAWLCAPASVRQELVTAEVTEADTFTVTRLRKAGNRESDPYRAEIEVDEARPDDEQVA